MKIRMRELRLVITLLLTCLALSCSRVDNRQVTLVWEDNSVDELGFIIERKHGEERTYSQIAVVDANVTRYSDSLFTSASATYYYRVCAFNLAGKSAYSNEVHTQVPSAY